MSGKKILKISAITAGVLAVLAGILVAVYMFVIAPTFIGRTGPEGEMLKKFIEPAELKKLTEKPDESIWIIDVRSEENFRKGHIPTAKSFYSGTIMSRLDELPKDKYLIIYCETGGRVQSVIRKLSKEGYTRYMNWGGNSRWPYERATGDN